MNVTTYAVVGQPVTRDDGPEKVSGRTCYAGDLRLPGMLWGKVLHSPFPHARIVRMDTSGALQLPDSIVCRGSVFQLIESQPI
jgi:CO/xanthine dehydrogenase Mo-binding subunit